MINSRFPPPNVHRVTMNFNSLPDGTVPCNAKSKGNEVWEEKGTVGSNTLLAPAWESCIPKPFVVPEKTSSFSPPHKDAPLLLLYTLAKMYGN